MKSDKILETCKYYDNGKCPHQAAYLALITEAEARNENVSGLQPKCPRDAQRNKRGILSCICERGERL